MKRGERVRRLPDSALPPSAVGPYLRAQQERNERHWREQQRAEALAEDVHPIIEAAIFTLSQRERAPSVQRMAEFFGLHEAQVRRALRA